MTNEEERRELNRIVDIYRESVSNYWTSLLTANTIIIAVFSAMSLFNSDNNYLIFILVILSMISSYLLIKNFRTFKNTYYNIGLLMYRGETDGNIIKDVKSKEASNGNRTKNRTLITEIILAIEAFTIIIILLRNLDFRFFDWLFGYFGCFFSCFHNFIL